MDKLGIKVKDTKSKENMYFFYSIDEKIEEVSYSKYNPDKELNVYGPIMLDFTYEQE